MDSKDVKKEETKKPDKYEVEDALRTLMRACEVQSDSALMAEVQKLAEKQKKAITSISALKDVARKKINEDAE